MKAFKNDDRNNLDSVGFDTSVFDRITENEIRDYFTAENFAQMMGPPCTEEGEPVGSWIELIDFESFISAAISDCEESGKLIEA